MPCGIVSLGDPSGGTLAGSFKTIGAAEYLNVLPWLTLPVLSISVVSPAMVFSSIVSVNKAERLVRAVFQDRAGIGCDISWVRMNRV